MPKKVLGKKAAEKKLMPQIIMMLEAQGGKSLEQARKRLSYIGVENAEAIESMEMYADNWNDVIHPAILSLSAEAVSKRALVVTDLQVMVLLLTSAMDIHDDVMDKSMTKNGKITLFGKFGEDLAILVGDALLMESLMMLNSLGNSMAKESFDHITVTVKNSLLEVGNAHLMELQLKRNANVLPQEILDLIEKKAAIFEGIAGIGAVAAGGSPEQIDVLKKAARAFGYLVMLRDEFIDMFEQDELSSRVKNEYPPLPIIYAIKDPKVKEYITTLRRKKITKKSMQELINLVYENQNVISLKEMMKSRAIQTTELLNRGSLNKKPASLLASLIDATLEDL
ncbi:MAG: polyprenyl synthetase family protein [Candidatus Bathyarchaeia archaeon]